jgi:hypothetical protein
VDFLCAKLGAAFPFYEGSKKIPEILGEMYINLIKHYINRYKCRQIYIEFNRIVGKFSRLRGHIKYP